MKVYVSPGSGRLECPRASEESGHLADVHFVWQNGSEHAEYHATELTCSCGRKLVRVGGTDPYKHPFREIEGTPHGA